MCNKVLYDLLSEEQDVKLQIVSDPTLGVAILDLKEEFVCLEADMHRRDAPYLSHTL